MINFIEKWKFKFFGRGVQAFCVEECDNQLGKVLILRDIGKVKRRANSLLESWNSKGWEITSPPVQLIRNDVYEPAYVVLGGETVDLFTIPSIYPNRENIIGAASHLDDIGDSLDMGKSPKNLFIGAIAGMLLYAGLIGPMLSAMFS